VNTLAQEAYLSDLKDENDYRQYYVRRITQIIASEDQKKKAMTAGSDEEAVQGAVITWLNDRLKAQ